MIFEFATAGRIVFGPGAFEANLAAISEHAARLCVITGKDRHRFEEQLDLIRSHCDIGLVFGVHREPTLEIVETAARRAREAGSDAVIGLGGGSVIDTAKAVAALLTNSDPLLEYLEVIGRGKPLDRSPAWMAAVPTTSGTGAEVTRNAVLASPEHRVKVSMRSPSMLPDLAIVDPTLTLGLPPEITAATGMDALTQLIEAYVSNRATPMTDALCVEGLSHCAPSLETVFRDGQNLDARSDMALASLFSGMALANGGLGAVHGIAGPLGGMIPGPHGVLCGRLLPHVFQANARLLESDPGGQEIIGRFRTVSRLLTGETEATVEDGVDWLFALTAAFDLPGISHFGLTPADLPDVADHALNASSMRGNPVHLDREQIVEILNRALD
jgi:alcohol dehydrogenase class IV